MFSTFVGDLWVIATQMRQVFLEVCAATELEIVSRALGWSGQRCPKLGQGTPKSLLTLVVKAVKHHAAAFAAVTEALRVAGGYLPACAWALFLDSVLERLVNRRVHLTMTERDAKRFLGAQRLLAAVAAARVDLSRLLVSMWGPMCPQSLSTGKLDPSELVGALASDVTKMASDARGWWAVGEDDLRLTDHVWQVDAWCVEARKALRAAAHGVVEVADRYACTAVPPFSKMVHNVTADCFGTGDDEDSTRWDPGFILLADPVTGPVCEAVLPLLVADIDPAYAPEPLIALAQVLADYLSRAPFKSDVVLCAVRDIRDDAAGALSNAICSSKLYGDNTRLRRCAGFAYPSRGNGECWVRALTRAEVRFWWCVDSACPDGRALARWRAIVLDGILNHMGIVLTGVCWYSGDNVPDQVFEEASMIAYETGRTQELKSRALEQLDRMWTKLVPVPDGVAHMFQDFVDLCEGIKGWTPLRAAWLGAVHRGGRARMARKLQGTQRTQRTQRTRRPRVAGDGSSPNPCTRRLLRARVK